MEKKEEVCNKRIVGNEVAYWFYAWVVINMCSGNHPYGNNNACVILHSLVLRCRLMHDKASRYVI